MDPAVGMQMVLCCAGSGCGPEPMLHGTSQSWSLISHPAPAQETPLGTSQVVQWLRLHASNAGGMGLIPGQGTRSYMPCNVAPQNKLNRYSLRIKFCEMWMEMGVQGEKETI